MVPRTCRSQPVSRPRPGPPWRSPAESVTRENNTHEPASRALDRSPLSAPKREARRTGKPTRQPPTAEIAVEIAVERSRGACRSVCSAHRWGRGSHKQPLDREETRIQVSMGQIGFLDSNRTERFQAQGQSRTLKPFLVLIESTENCIIALPASHSDARGEAKRQPWNGEVAWDVTVGGRRDVALGNAARLDFVRTTSDVWTSHIGR